MEKTVDWIHPKMLARNRFLLLVVVGGVVLAIVSVSLQFCKYSLLINYLLIALAVTMTHYSV